MPDINPIQGPIGPKEDPQKRDQKIGTPEKFKEQYRIQAVDSTDTEAEAKKKKKKGLAQEEEETIEDSTAPTNAPPSSALSSSPLDIQPTSKKISEATSSQPAQTPTPYEKAYTPTGPSFTSLGDEGDTDDFTSNLPPAPPQSSQAPATASQPTQGSLPAQASGEGMSFSEDDFPTQQQIPSAGTDQNYPSPPSQNTTTQPSQPLSDASSTPSTQAPSEVSALPSKAKAAAPKGTKPIDKIQEAVSEKDRPVPRSSSALPPAGPKQAETLSGEKIEQKHSAAPAPAPIDAPAPPVLQKNKELTPEEAGLSWDDELRPAQAITSTSTEGGKKEGDKQSDDDAAAQAQNATPDIVVPFTIDPAAASQAPLPSYTTFSPAVLDMFEKMVGTITVLQESSGERKTTITLTSPNFAASAFYGAEIVIEEDLHLAPGQYNIRLVGSPEAVTLFQSKSDDLLAAFQSGNYNFKVQRLETSIQSTDKPLFKRKEGVKDDDGAGQGNNP